MSWPLWYLLALIVAVGIIYILLKIRVPENWIVVISVIMAIIGLGLDYCKENSILQPITDMYFSVFQKTRNGFFVGYLYVALGLLCSRIKEVPLIGVISLFVVGIIGIILKLPLANAFIVLSLFFYSASTQCCNLTIGTSKELRVMSSIIYFTHMLIMAILVLLIGLMRGVLLFFIVFIVTLMISRLFMRHSDSKIFQLFFS